MILKALLLIILSLITSFIIAPKIIDLLYKAKIVRVWDYDFASLAFEEGTKKSGTPIMGGLIFIITIAILSPFFISFDYIKLPLLVFIISALLGGLDDWLNIYGRERIVRPVHKHMLLAKVHKKLIYRIYYALTIPWNYYKNIWFALGSHPGKGIHSGEKIIVQTVTGLIVAWWAANHTASQELWLPFLESISLPWWLMGLLVTFTVVAMSNAVNISDGMDGLSSGLAISSLIGFLVIAIDLQNIEIVNLTAISLGGLLTYLYFNIKPARVEMGDVGSLALGTLISIIAISLDRVMILPIMCLPYVFEIGSSLLQGIYRKLRGQRLFKMAPLHLHFLIKGWSEEKIVMRAWWFGVITTIVALTVHFI